MEPGSIEVAIAVAKKILGYTVQSRDGAGELEGSTVFLARVDA